MYSKLHAAAPAGDQQHVSGSHDSTTCVVVYLSCVGFSLVLVQSAMVLLMRLHVSELLVYSVIYNEIADQRYCKPNFTQLHVPQHNIVEAQAGGTFCMSCSMQLCHRASMQTVH